MWARRYSTFFYKAVPHIKHGDLERRNEISSFQVRQLFSFCKVDL